MWHRPYVLSYEIGNPSCSCYKTSKPLCDIAHMFSHMKLVTPHVLVTKRVNLMCHHPYVLSYEIGNPLCSCYKMSKPWCVITHMFFHTKLVTPCGIITKPGNPYIGTFYYKTSNPLSLNFNFTKIGNPYFQTIKTKDNNPKWLFWDLQML